MREIEATKTKKRTFTKVSLVLPIYAILCTSHAVILNHKVEFNSNQLSGGCSLVPSILSLSLSLSLSRSLSLSLAHLFSMQISINNPLFKTKEKNDHTMVWHNQLVCPNRFPSPTLVIISRVFLPPFSLTACRCSLFIFETLDMIYIVPGVPDHQSERYGGGASTHYVYMAPGFRRVQYMSTSCPSFISFCCPKRTSTSKT